MATWDQAGDHPTEGGSSTTGDVQQQAKQAASEARDAASQAADQAKQKADQALGAVQQQASALVNDQITRASSAVGGVAQALRSTSEELRNQEQGNLARYTDQVAEQLDSISTHLQNGDVGTLLHDVERFARREPAIFMSGALAAGLLLARFLKSSNEQQGRQRYAGRNRYPIEEYRGGYGRGGSQGESPYGGPRSYGREYDRYAEPGQYGGESQGYQGAQSHGGRGAAGDGQSRPGERPGRNYGATGLTGGNTAEDASLPPLSGEPDRDGSSTGWRPDEGV